MKRSTVKTRAEITAGLVRKGVDAKEVDAWFDGAAADSASAGLVAREPRVELAAVQLKDTKRVERRVEVVQRKNEESPVFVAALPKGRDLVRWQLCRCEGCRVQVHLDGTPWGLFRLQRTIDLVAAARGVKDLGQSWALVVMGEGTEGSVVRLMQFHDVERVQIGAAGTFPEVYLNTNR